MSASRIYQKTIQNVVTVVIPERVQQKERFIHKAKEIGAWYWLHTVIREYMDKVTVPYTLENGVSYGSMHNLMVLADDFYCQEEKNTVLLTLDYYTHATYHNGRKVFPMEDLV